MIGIDIGLDLGFQHLVLVALLVLFYFLPAESFPKQRRHREE